MAFSPTAYTVLGISLTTISFRLFLATVTACFGVLRLALPRTLCWQYGRLRYVFDFSLQSLHTPANPIPNPQCMTFRSAGVYLAGHIAGRDTFPTLARGRYPFLRCMVFNSATYTVLAKSLAAIRFRLFSQPFPLSRYMAFTPVVCTLVAISLAVVRFRLLLAAITPCLGVWRLALPRLPCWQYRWPRYVSDIFS